MTGRTRGDSDQEYVIALCDEILGETAIREYNKFDWLVGDPGKNGTGRRLPVDAYYPEHRLVIEFHERQHSEPVAHFDKTEVVTVSGVHRGRQRRIYDERRASEIPRHGLRLRVIEARQLSADARGRLKREVGVDRRVLRQVLHS